MRAAETIYTIGHSTRTIEEFIEMLKHYGIEQVVDVRTIPRSRKNPQFNRDELEHVLPSVGINYTHLKSLGGLRRPMKDSPNGAWRNDSFRGYADYMQTPQFEEAVSHLMEIAANTTTAIMCAETLPWRCHRTLIADAMVVRGFSVTEIFDKDKSQPHRITQFALVEGQKITYPPSNA